MVSNVNSINAYSTWMSNSANNVANINTKDYNATDTTMIQNDSNSVVASSSKSSTSTNLAKETTDQMVASTGFDAQVKAVKTQEELIGGLINMLA